MVKKLLVRGEMFFDPPFFQCVADINDMRMNPGNMAMLVAISKSVDILIGFIIGYMSDNAISRWGRRKPFM